MGKIAGVKGLWNAEFATRVSRLCPASFTNRFNFGEARILPSVLLFIGAGVGVGVGVGLGAGASFTTFLMGVAGGGVWVLISGLNRRTPQIFYHEKPPQ